MTLEELGRYDGRNGRKAYVAVQGKIYDVTHSPLWAGGDHQGDHQAGCDLTEELKSAPHVRAVIDRFPQIGELTAAKPSAPGRKLAVIGALLLALGAVLLLILH